MPLSNDINSVSTAIGELQPGSLAELRRVRGDSFSAPAFWRLLASLPLQDDPEEERRWAVILSAMASLRGLHRAGHPLGRSLKEAEIPEPRVVQLLQAHGPGLEAVLRRLVQMLRNKGQVLDCTDVARLVLSDGRTDEDIVRRRIARHYFS